MNLIKTSIWTALSTLIKLMTGVVSSKIIAIYIGPAGMAVTGNLANFLSIASTFASGATNAGVVKYVAEYHDDQERKNKIISTALVLSMICSVVISLPTIVFSKQLSVLFLKDAQYASIFVVFGFTLIMFALNGIMLAIINGQKDIKKFTIINIVANLFGFAFSAVMIIYFRLYGALMAMAISQSIVFIITLIFIFKEKWFSLKIVKSGMHKGSAKQLFKFSIMSIVSILTVPIAQLVLRNYIIDHFSAQSAGYWEAVSKISGIYLMIITTSLATYYLPRLSELKENMELRKEIFNGYKILLPLTIVLSLAIFFSRDLIIYLLFTKEFLPVREYFTFQLIGDFFKISSWIIAYLMIAKAMGKLFIVTEIVFSVSYVGLSYLFMQHYGAIGITYGYAVNYAIYLVFMMWVFRGMLFSNKLEVNQ